MLIQQALALLPGQRLGRFLIARENQVVVIDLSQLGNGSLAGPKGGISALFVKFEKLGSHFISDFGP